MLWRAGVFLFGYMFFLIESNEPAHVKIKTDLPDYPFRKGKRLFFYNVFLSFLYLPVIVKHILVKNKQNLFIFLNKYDLISMKKI